MERHGLRGETPIINASMKRGGYNAMSVVTAEGKMQYSIKDGTINGEVFIKFMKQLIDNRDRPLILMVDHASFHKSKAVRDFVHQHRSKLRIFFLPKHVPEMNPDEQVWNEIKTHKMGKQPIKDKVDLKKRLHEALASLQKKYKRIISFFNYRIRNTLCKAYKCTFINSCIYIYVAIGFPVLAIKLENSQ